MRICRLLSLAVLALTICLPVQAQELLKRKLEPGEHAVGFRIVQKYDASRSYFPSKDYFGQRTQYPLGRPMQVAIWYPAAPRKGAHRMHMGDYPGFSASDIEFAKSTDADRKRAIEAQINGASEASRAGMARLLEEETAVYLDADIVAGQWPIILYAPPLNTAFFDNSVLCEYLASKGYLVLAATAKGEYTRLQAPTVRSVEVQADDLGYLLQLARQYSSNEHIGTMGFSRGGLANLIFAMKDKDVSATVSIDGSVFSDGWLKDIAASPYYQPAELTSDLLMITKNLANPQLNPATYYEAAIHANRSLVRFDHDVHGYFSAWALLEDLVKPDPNHDLERYADFYAEMVGYVGAFFDASLKKSGKFEEHARKQFPHSFTAASAVRNMDPASVNFWIRENGIDYVNKVIEDILRSDSDYLSRLNWRDLDLGADNALAAGSPQEALKILLLADRVAPGWYVINEKIGQRYLALGERANALKYFSAALDDNPRSVTSKQGLKELGVEPTQSRQNPPSQPVRVAPLRGNLLAR